MTETCSSYAHWPGQTLNNCERCNRKPWEHDFYDGTSDTPFGEPNKIPWPAERIELWKQQGVRS